MGTKSHRKAQIRPKAANSKILAAGISADGETHKINPKGFYLRTSFTRQILIQNKSVDKIW